MRELFCYVGFERKAIKKFSVPFYKKEQNLFTSLLSAADSAEFCDKFLSADVLKSENACLDVARSRIHHNLVPFAVFIAANEVVDVTENTVARDTVFDFLRNGEVCERSGKRLVIVAAGYNRDKTHEVDFIAARTHAGARVTGNPFAEIAL